VTATDNCGGTVTPVLQETQSNPGSSCNNVITRTWTATDSCGNTATASQRITVNDTTRPTLSGVPADPTVQCLTNVPPPAAVTATDNCGGPVTVVVQDTQSNLGSSCNNVLTRTWTATDGCGNSATTSQHISVNDTTPPALNGVPGGLTVQCLTNVPPAAVAAANDNVGGIIPV